VLAADLGGAFLAGGYLPAALELELSVSQLLWRSDVELHPGEGGEFEEKPHQGVQAPVLPTGSHRREAPRPDLPRAQPLRKRALEKALAARQPAPGLIHHSDQGVQYASSEYVLRLEDAGAQISMAAVGNPYENAKAESFFRTLKMEEVYLKDYQDFEEAYENIGQFIEEVYNHKRLHSSLGYLPPVEFEALHAL
jgi:Integrase core domain